MDISPAARQQIAAEAVEWFLYFQSSEWKAKDHQALGEWLTRSPVHIEEYLALSATWVGLTVPNAGEFETDALIAAARDPERTKECSNVYELKTSFDSDRQLISQQNGTQRRDRRFQYGWPA